MNPLFIAAGLQGLYGLFQSERSGSQAQKMVKPAGYEITPEQRASQARAEEMAQQGYTGQEKASFYQNMAAQSNLGYQRAMRGAGGNQWGGAILAGVQSPSYGAVADFAARDAALKRQNVRYADQMGEQISAQRNRQTGLANQQYIQQQQAYGAAQKQGIQNIMNAGWMLAGAYKPGAGTTPPLNDLQKSQMMGSVGAAPTISPMGAMSQIPTTSTESDLSMPSWYKPNYLYKQEQTPSASFQ